MGIMESIFGYGKRRPDRVSSKNKSRTGGQKKFASGIDKNDTHLSPERKARGDKKQAHKVKNSGGYAARRK